ncbi:MAG: energy-coupling factor transporter transmembrane protein EcfT [Treponema sp.]|nr:energy-coupling factor transporter transmembrane protein EcfT [Treponema sp.]
MRNQSFFHYIPGKTFLHKMQPWIKIILMLTLAIAAFYCPLVPALCIFFTLATFSLTYLRFSPRNLLSDIRPALIYFFLLYMASTFSNITPGEKICFPEMLVPKKYYMELGARLLLSMETTSIFFRTTTQIQLNHGFRQIESALTRRKKTPVADLLSLTLNFVPRLSELWQKISLAWESRGGKNGPRKIKTLTTILFRTGMDESYKKSQAIKNRM